MDSAVCVCMYVLIVSKGMEMMVAAEPAQAPIATSHTWPSQTARQRKRRDSQQPHT